MIETDVLPTYKKVFVQDLNPFASNSRTHSKDQVKQIEASIKEFGFTNPILIDEENTIIAGHGRLDAAKKLKMSEVPCIVLEGLTQEQRAAYVIADNKIALNAGWDIDILCGQLDLLRDQDFDLSLTGFSVEEIGDIFGIEESPGLVEDDAVPEALDPITKHGDVWLLGSHRLLCGDSTVQTDVDRLLDGQQPNTMVTDPPYGVNLDMSWRDTAKPDGAKNNKNKVANDDRADWYDAYILFPGNVAYVWHASAYTDVVMKNLRDADFDVKQQIIWRKPHLVLGRANYHWQHEPCWYGVRKGANHNWKGDRKQTTVWDVAAPNASCSGSKDDKTSHPTQKPVELFKRSVEHHTNPGEYVYDPFGGSGTLMVACEKIGRRALMMELDPKYCDVIITRFEQFTGKKAVLERNNDCKI